MTLSEVKNKINSILRESTMNEAGISRMYTVFLGVQNKVKNQETELKSLLVKWKSEKDDKKRASIQSDMKNKTKTLKKTRANLSDIEANYINKMSYDDSYSESVNEAKVDSILKRIKSAYDKSKNKKLDIKKLKDQLKTYKKLGASDKKDQIKAGELFIKSIDELLNEVKEHDVITQLRKIVKDNQNALVVDTKSKKKVRVDMQSASLMVQVYDAIKQQSSKDKFVNSGIVQMGKFSWKILNK